MTSAIDPHTARQSRDARQNSGPTPRVALWRKGGKPATLAQGLLLPLALLPLGRLVPTLGTEAGMLARQAASATRAPPSSVTCTT